MLIQLQSQYLTILELELKLFTVEVWIVLVDDAVVIRTDDNDVRRVVVLRASKVVNMVSFHHAIALRLAKLLATNLVAIAVELLEHSDDAAINLAVLHQQFLLNHRGRLVCHEELVIIACLIHLLRNSVEGICQLLIVGIGATLHAQHVARCS